MNRFTWHFREAPSEQAKVPGWGGGDVGSTEMKLRDFLFCWEDTIFVKSTVKQIMKFSEVLVLCVYMLVL